MWNIGQEKGNSRQESFQGGSESVSLGSRVSLSSSVVQRGVAAQWRRDKIMGSKC